MHGVQHRPWAWFRRVRSATNPQETPGFGAKAAGVIADDEHEEICLEARRHGIVLARPLLWAIVLGGVGGVLTTLPQPVDLVGDVVVALAVVIALRAVWKWEQTRIVVTTEKVFVVNGTLRRKAQAVRLRAVEAVELEQTFAGQLLGYGRRRPIGAGEDPAPEAALPPG